MKICTGCDRTLPVTEFTKRSASRDGLDFRCRSCKLAASNAWAQASPDKRRASYRRHHEKNREKRLEQGRQWRAKNKAHHNATVRRWQAANPEREKSAKRRWKQKNHGRWLELKRASYARTKDVVLKRAAAYRAAHPEMQAKQSLQKRARRKSASPAWADQEKIRAIYVEARRLTAETGIRHHVDHEIPLQGKLVCGLHVHNNLRILHAVDNMRKGNKFDIDFSL